MWKRLAFAAALAVLSMTASAQAACRDYDFASSFLKKNYGESKIAVGKMIDPTGKIFPKDQLRADLLAKRNGGSWSLLITGPGNISCLMLAGKGLFEGNLGRDERFTKIVEMFPPGDYTNLTVVGHVKDGLGFAVITTNESDWKLFLFDQYGIGREPVLQGENWRKATSTDPEV